MSSAIQRYIEFAFLFYLGLNRTLAFGIPCSCDLTMSDSLPIKGPPCLSKTVFPKQTFWINCAIDSPNNVTSGALLYLGRIADDDETYFNGNLIGTSKMSRHLMTWNYFVLRQYFVPKNFLKIGDANLISIKVTSVTGGKAGFVDGTPRFSRTFVGTLPRPIDLAASLFAIFIVTIFAIFETSSSRAKELKRWFVIGGIFTSVLLFWNSFYLYRVFPSFENLTFKIHIILTAFTVFILYRYSEELLGFKKRGYLFWFTLAVSLAVALAPGWGLDLEKTRKLAVMFGLWGIPVIAYGGYLIFSSINVLIYGSKKYVLPFLGGASVLIILGGIDLMSLFRGGLPVSVPLSGIGFLAAFVMAAASFVLVDRQVIEDGLKIDVQQWKRRHDDIKTEAEVGKITRQVAHDVRSPISALNMVSQMNAITPETRQLMRSAIARINQIADDLLMFREPLAQATDLKQIFQTLILEKRTLNNSANINFISKTHYPAERPPVIPASEVTLSRILSNLIDNSLRAISAGGTIEVRLTQLLNEFVIEVKDDGKGMSPDELESIGTKGFSSWRDGQISNGLGVHHAKSTVVKWGGRFKVTSVATRGSCFQFSVPILENQD